MRGARPAPFSALYIAACSELITVQIVEELCNPAGYLVSDSSNRSQALAARVRQFPVDVALAGDEGALVAASHRYDQVGLLSQLAGEELRCAV